MLWVLAGCATPEGNPAPHRPASPTRAPSVECVSLLGRPLHALPPDADRAKLEAALAQALADLQAHPDDPTRIVWVGRRLGYLWRIREAVEVFTRGIDDHPTYAPLYRHRGHRYITLRDFDAAVADLTKASQLLQGRPDEMEPDGMPNARNIPLTTTAYNVWYHLGVAHYLQGDFEAALSAFHETLRFVGGYDDNLVASSDWTYMTLRRLGRDSQAGERLQPIHPDMEIIENTAYHRRLLMCKGLLQPTDLLDMQAATPLDLATYGYGVGNWYLYNGDRAKALQVFERVVDGPYWPAFGFIAAEVELHRNSR